jgi:hypothetical protein
VAALILNLIKAQGVAEAQKRGEVIVAEEKAKVDAMDDNEVQQELDKLRRPR